MKIAIMQPYLFPYLGYFQLINAVDIFIVYDDVQYIKGGWINRNNILVNGKKHLFTFSLRKDSYKLNINRRYFSHRFDTEKNDFFQTLKLQYGKSEDFPQTFEVINTILTNNEPNIARMITMGLNKLCNYLGVKTEISVSSNLANDKKLKGQERVINIVKYLNGTQYINLSGGQTLYSKDEFSKHGLDLKFLKTKNIVYRQFTNEFVPNLSIIDVMMFNSKHEIQKLLNEYELV